MQDGYKENKKHIPCLNPEIEAIEQFYANTT